MKEIELIDIQNNQHDIIIHQPTHQQPHVENMPHEEPINIKPIDKEEIGIRRSTRNRKTLIFSDCVVYLQESDFDVRLKDDLVMFSQAMSRDDSKSWYEVVKEEMESVAKNQVWDLVELPKGVSIVGCKWVFKTKRDSKGNVERYKARLVVKGFTQKEGIDYHEMVSLVSKKDSFRIIMALVAHFDLELHEVDVKTTFLNESLEEEMYMAQPMGFESKKVSHLVCLEDLYMQ